MICGKRSWENSWCRLPSFGNPAVIWIAAVLGQDAAQRACPTLALPGISVESGLVKPEQALSLCSHFRSEHFISAL
jgi:hypothetical protein